MLDSSCLGRVQTDLISHHSDFYQSSTHKNKLNLLSVFCSVQCFDCISDDMQANFARSRVELTRVWNSLIRLQLPDLILIDRSKSLVVDIGVGSHPTLQSHIYQSSRDSSVSRREWLRRIYQLNLNVPGSI